jgi:hypothetical protein
MQWLWRNNSNTLALVLCAKSSDVAAVPSVLQTAITTVYYGCERLQRMYVMPGVAGISICERL